MKNLKRDIDFCGYIVETNGNCWSASSLMDKTYNNFSDNLSEFCSAGNCPLHSNSCVITSAELKARAFLKRHEQDQDNVI